MADSATLVELPQFKGRPGWEFTDLSELDLEAYAPAPVAREGGAGHAPGEALHAARAALEEQLHDGYSELLVVTPAQLAAAVLNRADHAVNVIVAHAANSKLDFVFWRRLPLLRNESLFHNGHAAACKSRGAHHYEGTKKTCVLQKIATRSRTHSQLLLN